MITRLIAAFRRWVARRRREALLARINAEIATRRQHHALMSAMAERRAGLVGETLAKAKDAQDEMAAIISAKGEQA